MIKLYGTLTFCLTYACTQIGLTWLNDNLDGKGQQQSMYSKKHSLEICIIIIESLHLHDAYDITPSWVHFKSLFWISFHLEISSIHYIKNRYHICKNRKYLTLIWNLKTILDRALSLIWISSIICTLFELR